MKDESTKQHPGPWRVMRINPGLAGLLVAAAFLAMGLVTMPILVVAAVSLGIVVALFLRFTRKA